ncbi:heat shock protein 9/12-domain-containing protein [Cerioporus squamosus]|nr:heat shock protein 9/12-domain-containing protein [Cerioporus squamosus]
MRRRLHYAREQVYIPGEGHRGRHQRTHDSSLPPNRLITSALPLRLTIMSDAGRQSFTDKASAAMKPDSEKSTTEHFGDKFKGKSDSAASSMQPQSQKSTGQQIGDAFSSNSNETEPSMVDRAKNAMGLGNNQS